MRLLIFIPKRRLRLSDVIAVGAVWCDTAAECAKDACRINAIVGYPKDVEEVYLVTMESLKC